MGGGGGGGGGMCTWCNLSQLMFKTVLFPHVRAKMGRCLGQFGVINNQNSKMRTVGMKKIVII